MKQRTNLSATTFTASMRGVTTLVAGAAAILLLLTSCAPSGGPNTPDFATQPGTTHAEGACVANPEAVVRAPAQNRESPLPGEEVQRFEEAALQAFEESGAPGAVVGISSDRGTWIAAFGTAQIDTMTGAGLVGGAPMERGTHVRVGSITKTFTGTVAAQLDALGLLSLDDSIEEYWPGIPHGASITLRHLANMTSGIASYTTQEPFHEALFGDPYQAFTSEQLVAYALPASPLFNPGEDFDYSNTNTILLAAAIEQVTGQPISQVIVERITRPLELRETSWPEDGGELPAPFAEGLSAQGVDDEAKEPATQDATHWNPSWAGAAGSIISTVDDLLTYGHALATGQGILSVSDAEERLRSFPEGARIGYGLGFACYSGWVGHEGSLPGYNIQLAYDTKSNTTVVVAVNSDIRVGDCEIEQGEQRSGLTDDRCLTPASRILIPLSEKIGNTYTPPGA